METTKSNRYVSCREDSHKCEVVFATANRYEDKMEHGGDHRLFEVNLIARQVLVLA